MAYIGANPQVSLQEYLTIDDISGSFNGTLTSFALLVGGVAPVPGPKQSNQLLISLNGVIQEPDDTGSAGFRLSGGNIIFSSAPASSTPFFGVVLAGADYVYAGTNFPDGSVTTPSITFANDLDSGFYRTGSGELAYTSNGTFRLKIDSSGRLGLGTSSPAAALHVTSSNAGGYGGVLYNTSSTGEGLVIRAGSTSSHNILVAQNYDGSAARFVVNAAGNVGIGANSPSNLLHIAGTGTDLTGLRIVNTQHQAAATSTAGLKFGITNSAGQRNCRIQAREEAVDSNAIALDFFTNGADAVDGETVKMTVLSSGNVGVGTSSPSQKLHIVASSGVNNCVRAELSGTATYETAAGNFINTDTGTGSARGINVSGTDFGVYCSSGTNYFAGNVGIGTTSPQRELHVQGATNGTIRIQAANSATSQLLFSDSDAEIRGRVGYYHPDDALDFYSAGQERFRIDSSGRLLVGTATARANFNNSTATASLQVEGTDFNNSSFAIIRNSADSNAGGLMFAKSRSASVSGNTAVQAGDILGQILLEGNDGSEFVVGANIKAVVDGTPGANDMPTRLVFETTADGASGTTERMRITKEGYTKCSNTAVYSGGSNSYHESVSNTADWTHYFQNTNGSAPYGIVVKYAGAAPNDTSKEFFYAFDASALRFNVRSNGGIANYQSNNANLCDEREKKNIEALDSTWGCLKNWDLKKFHYNEDADTDDKRYGVIAQQVAPHCPEVITEWVKKKAEDAVLDEDGNVVTPAVEEVVRMGVKEQQMMWMAIKALQEAQTRIETLEAEVAALKGA